MHPYTQTHPMLNPLLLQHNLTTHQGAYFIGKAIWGKGYRELINLGAEYEKV